MPTVLKLFIFILSFSASFVCISATSKQLKGIDVTASDISKTAIAFINISTSPGLDTSQINVNKGDVRQTTISRTAMGFETDIPIHNSVLDGYFGASLISASLKDNLIVNYNGKTDIDLNLTRDIVALRALGGFSIPVTKNLHFKPYASIVVSQFDSGVDYFDSVEIQPILNNSSNFSQTDALTLAGTLELTYSNQWQDHTIKADLQYTATTTETFDEINELLTTEGNVHTLVFKSYWTVPTSWKTKGNPWNFSTFYNHINFLNHTGRSLGFDYYHELGVGMDYQLNVKPMNWFFAFRYVGIKASTLFGDDVEGYSVEVYFR